MSLLFESIKVVDGRFYNLFYHEQRMIRSLDMLWGVNEDVNLELFLSNLKVPAKGVFKCRVEYDAKSKQVEFVPYEPKSVRSLKVVEHDYIAYEFKYKHRKVINELFGRREDCDDILIVRKGNVTDSSYANVAFRKGKKWYTPESALLQGTMRQKLLDANKIQTVQIQITDIKSFDSCKLINAMLEFDAPEIDVSNIVL
jgi:4-amino-4-deoxychorismate lyase